MKKLPEQFISRLSELADDAYRKLPEIINAAEPVVAVRINPNKNTCGNTVFSDASPVAWNENGLYLDTRPSFTIDPRLHQGRYYVQDASSMAVAAAVAHASAIVCADKRGHIRYLDACAAPGGKTTAAIDCLPDDTFVVANEFDGRRANILIENLVKWSAEAFVTRGDAASLPFPDEFFDIISADVPCSGEGMMRKDPFAIEQWSPALVKECSAVQSDIVDNLWRALRPGGFLIYSTCTFNLCENEEIVQHIISEFGALPVEIPFDAPGVIGVQGPYNFPAYRFVPGAVKGEGLFMAMLRKPFESSRANAKKRKPLSGKNKSPMDFSKIIDGGYSLVSTEPLRLVRNEHLADYEYLSSKIKPLAAGIEPGAMKGRDFIPSQQLALSTRLVRGYFPEADISLETALSYLRREAVALPADTPRGIVLLTFDGFPLGWVKNLGTRANNLYPDSWRIRSL